METSKSSTSLFALYTVNLYGSVLAFEVEMLSLLEGLIFSSLLGVSNLVAKRSLGD